MIGKEEQLITNHSQGSSRGSRGSRNLSRNVSTSSQERLLVKLQEVMQLQPGEFIGQTVESTIPYFRAQTREISVGSPHLLKPFIQFDTSIHSTIITILQKVKRDVGDVVGRYPQVAQKLIF